MSKRKDYYFNYCEKCKNHKICKENHWFVTFDNNKIIQQLVVCDNFENKE